MALDFAVKVYDPRDPHAPLPLDLRDLLTVQANASTNSAAGTWTITAKNTSLAKRYDHWHQIIPQLVVEVYVDRDRPIKPSESKQRILRGLVDRNSKDGSVGDGNHTTKASIRGRDMMKLLVNAQIFFDLYREANDGGYWALTDNRVSIKDGAAERVISELLQDFLYTPKLKTQGLASPWRHWLPPKLLPISFDAASEGIGMFDLGGIGMQLNQGPMPLLAALQQASLAPLGELFYDGVDSLHFRPKPWTKAAWDTLRAQRGHQLDDADLLNWSIDYTDAEVTNYWMTIANMIVTTNVGKNIMAGRFPPGEEELLLYGLKQQTVQWPIGTVNYLDTTVDKELQTNLDAAARLLKRWHERPYKHATIAIKGRHVRPGDVVTLTSRVEPLLNAHYQGRQSPPEPGQWYVERVSHDFAVAPKPKWITNLTLSESRAYPHKDLDESILTSR